jgi:hypothetical protein
VTEVADPGSNKLKRVLTAAALAFVISLAALFLQSLGAAQPAPLLNLFLRSLIVAAVYAIAATFCRMSIAAATAAVALLWHLAPDTPTSWPVLSLGLLNLIGVAALLPSYVRWVSKKQLAAAGAVAGIAFIVQRDAGVALLLVEILLLGSVALWHIGSPRMAFWFEKALPVVAGFAILAIPCAIFLVLPQTAHWHLAAHLDAHLAAANSPKIMESVFVLAVVVLSFFTAVMPRSSLSGSRLANDGEYRQIRGYLVAFGLLAAMMYLLASVRLGFGQIYLAVMPCFLLIAVLLEHNAALRSPLRWIAIGLAALGVVAAVSRLQMLAHI